MATNKIMVHEKALAHLSPGLYRSPASALRELISNAWDASARTVHLSTNYPNFMQLVIQDDGSGFTRDEFHALMGGGIGNSLKREKPRPLIAGRPTIGKLGIGMLGIAQICGGFTIVSRPQSGTGFRAKVTLYDLLRERLDTGDKTIVSETDNEIKEVTFGEYEFLDASDLKDRAVGTTIIADDMHPTFVRAFQEDVARDDFEAPPLEWRDCAKLLSKALSVHELGDYWRLLWELAASCPVPYLSATSVPKRLIAADQKKLLKYDFRVLVDDRQLFKPVHLTSSKYGFTTAAISYPSTLVYGRPLAFHGYVAVQEGDQICPGELRGIAVRIRNVAVGYYDASFLDYRINQGPRSRWVTGEIFVDEGLEDALNIDRDSFNRFHPEFREVQEKVHAVLSKDIFPKVYSQLVLRSLRRRREIAESRARHGRTIMSEVMGKPVRMRTRSSADESSGVHIVTDTPARLELSLPPPGTLAVKKPNQELARSLLALFALSMREHSRDKQREVFERLLLQLLNGW